MAMAQAHDDFPKWSRSSLDTPYMKCWATHCGTDYHCAEKTCGQLKDANERHAALCGYIEDELPF
jgi:hypothetical protein